MVTKKQNAQISKFPVLDVLHNAHLSVGESSYGAAAKAQ